MCAHLIMRLWAAAPQQSAHQMRMLLPRSGLNELNPGPPVRCEQNDQQAKCRSVFQRHGGVACQRAAERDKKLSSAVVAVVLGWPVQRGHALATRGNNDHQCAQHVAIQHKTDLGDRIDPRLRGGHLTTEHPPLMAIDAVSAMVPDQNFAPRHTWVMQRRSVA